MDAIKRDIYVLRDTIQYRIEVTRGTNMIPIELTIRDFNIPTTATAVAYGFSSRNDEPSKMMCDIVEKTIKFTPSGIFFETGLNQLMIRIINDGKRLISFEVPVWCKDNKIRESDKSEEDQQTLIEQLLEKNGNLTDQVDKERKRIDNLVAPGQSAIGLAKKQLTKDANKLSQTEGSHTHSTSWTSTGSDDDATFLASVKDKNVFVLDCFCRTHSSKTSTWENTYHEAEATITINDDSVSVSATYTTTDTNTDAAIFTVVLGYDEENREIADIRVDSDGVIHDSAGAAVRAQTKDVPDMRDCLQSPYVDIDLLELGNINKDTGVEEDSTKILRSERFKWNKDGKITAPSGYVITTANYNLQTHIGDNGAYTREVYQSTGGYANGMSHPQADSDKDVRRLLIKRSDGADINVEDLRGKITTNVPDLRAMDVLDKMQEEIENVQIDTDTTLTKEGAPADAAETGRRILQSEESLLELSETIFNLSTNLLNLEDENFLLGSRYANYSAGSYIMTDSGYFVTGYIPCKKGDIVRVTYPNSATYANSIGVYDTNRKWLEGKKIGNNYSTKGEVEITNENAVYFRASISIANGKDTWKNICMITINNDMPSEFIECGKKTLRDNFNASDAYKTSKKNADLLDIEKDTFFFAPSEFYGIKGRLGRSRKIFIENLLVSHCLSDFYIISNTYNIYTHHDDNFLLFSDNGQSNIASIHRASNGERIYKSPDMHFRTVGKSNVGNPSDVKNVLMIGDSFTDGGYLPCEVKNILVNDLGLTKLNFVGHKTDTDGEVTCKNCGIGGITLQDYIKTDNTNGCGEKTWSNPFLFNGTISFKQYMQEYANGANLDIAVIECGINDLIALDSFDSEKAISKMKTMIDNIHSEYPECKIFVVGQKYANHVQTQLATYDWNVQVQKLNKGYFEICKDSNYSNYCTYVDIALMFDGLHFAPYEMKLLYKGSDETVRVITDWLHPNKAGYYAIAENIAGAIAYILFRKTL